MDGRLVLLVGLGGAIGSILRYLVTEVIPSNQTPFGTITVNLLGSMILGIMFGAIAADAVINQEYALLFGTGLLGAFTTCLLYTSPSPRDQRGSRMPSSA